MSALSQLLLLLVVALVSSTANTISNPFSDRWRQFESPLPLLEPFRGDGAEHSNRIVGGAVAANGSRPYQAAVLVDERFFCGGSLISEEYVVTAAHCAFNAQEMMIILGGYNLTAKEEEGRQIFIATTFIVHENYTMGRVHDDIALVKFESIVYSDTVKAITLPPADKDVAVGTSLIVSGWGKISDDAMTITPILEEVTVPSISNDDCEKVYPDLIGDGILCTAGTGGKGTCNGDSGGPLTGGTGDDLVLRGIVSFGHVGGCAQGDPDGFTRVDQYVDWIKDKTGIN